MKLFVPLAILLVIASGVGLYTLERSKPAPIPLRINQAAPSPTPVVTPIQTKESLESILGSTDSIVAAEQSVAGSAELSGSDSSLSAEDQTLRSLNTSTSATYAN